MKTIKLPIAWETEYSGAPTEVTLNLPKETIALIEGIQANWPDGAISNMTLAEYDHASGRELFTIKQDENHTDWTTGNADLVFDKMTMFVRAYAKHHHGIFETEAFSIDELEEVVC
jgi:hypothetical protein